MGAGGGASFVGQERERPCGTRGATQPGLNTHAGFDLEEQALTGRTPGIASAQHATWLRGGG